MMGKHHAISGAAAWVAVTSTAPFALGWDPLPAGPVVVGALVTAGAALLPDLDHESSSAARSGGLFTRGVAAAANAASGGHRHGMHSALAVAGFTVATVWAHEWETVVPGLGAIPAGSALVFLALVAFAQKALVGSRRGIVALWATALVVVVGVLALAPHELTWLPVSVMVGVIVHLVGDMLTTGGIPLLWPLAVKPPRWVHAIPLMSRVWKKNGNVALPVLGNTGSAREWVALAALSGYVVYGLAAVTGLIDPAMWA